MSRLSLAIAFFLLSVSSLSQQAAEQVNLNHHTGVNYIENGGQYPDEVLFMTPFAPGYMFVEQDGFTFSLYDREQINALHGQPADPNQELIRRHSYKQKWIGSSIPQTEAVKKKSHYVNFFLGSDKSAWRSGLGTYEEVFLKEFYQGIDMQLCQDFGNVKYNFIVHPGADPSFIQWSYDGVEKVRLENGMIEVMTSVGPMYEMKPFAFQIDKRGRKKPVPCAYEQSGDVMSFSFPDGYDPERALIIDPVLVFSSYSGSTADNWGYTATFDQEEFAYGGGIVSGAGYPLTNGAFDESFGGAWDVGITKFTEDGTDLVYSTYLGGTDSDLPSSIVVDNSNRLIVLGFTGSSDFPTSDGAFMDTYQGGTNVTPLGGITFTGGTDLFLAKFSEDGTALDASSYVGGLFNDGINPGLANNYGDEFRSEVLTDSGGNIYVASTTNSTTFPVTAGVQQEDNNGGQDAVIFKMSPDLTTMEWGTYWGGTGNDSGYSLEINSADEVYVVGATLNSDLAIPADGMEPNFGGGTDGYLVKFEEGVVTAGTYIGTSGYDVSFFVELDTQENVWITGQTDGDWEMSDDVYGNDGAGQFIQKINPEITESLLSSAFGNGDGFFSPINICPTAFLVDDCNRIFVSGWGGALNGFGDTQGMPTTPDAYQTTTDGSDFYIVVFEQDMSALLFGSYFGANVLSEHVDGGTSRFSPKGIIYQAVCAGCGSSDAFPTSDGAWSNTNNSTNCNLAVFKYDLEIESLVAVASISPEAQGCTPFTVEFSNSGSTGIENYWDFGDGNVSIEASPEHTYTEPGTYEVVYISIDPESCNLSDTTYLEVYVQDPLILDASFSIDTELCADSLRLFATYEGQGDYDQLIWNLGDGNTSGELDFIHIYNEAGLYTVSVTVTDDFCDNEEVQSQDILIDTQGAIDGDVKFPNVFTPNTDDHNKDFRPYIVSTGGQITVPLKSDMLDFFDHYEVQVYNRWGNLLFESDNATPFWDGKVDGEVVAEGVYYYIVKYNLSCSNDPETEVSGHMSLLHRQ